MSETDVAYRLLCDLERTLTGARDRLADLAVLAAGLPTAAAPPGAVALPPPEQLCAEQLPAPLVLPPEVEAPPLVVPMAAAEELSVR